MSGSIIASLLYVTGFLLCYAAIFLLYKGHRILEVDRCVAVDKNKLHIRSGLFQNHKRNRTRHKLSNFAKHGEVSYGVYLCGWPIQQTICMLFGGQMIPVVNFLLTLPFAICGGYLLHRFVEQPAARIHK